MSRRFAPSYLLAPLNVALLALLLASCAREEVAPRPGEDSTAALEASIAAQRDAIAAQKERLTAVDASWSLGETTSRVKGFYEGDSLLLVEEEMNMGEFGTARSNYVYSAKGGLIAYQEDKEAQSGVRAGNARTERVRLDLLFGENGAVLKGERTVDGAPAELTGLEAQGVKLHARELELVLREKRRLGGK